MKDWQSQAHVKWECKYHVVLPFVGQMLRFAPKKMGPVTKHG